MHMFTLSQTIFRVIVLKQQITYMCVDVILMFHTD